jgi:hypothetical protein
MSYYYDHHPHNHGLDKEQMAEKESRMGSIISQFLKNEISIFEMKQRLNILEKDEMDIV